MLSISGWIRICFVAWFTFDITGMFFFPVFALGFHFYLAQWASNWCSDIISRMFPLHMPTLILKACYKTTNFTFDLFIFFFDFTLDVCLDPPQDLCPLPGEVVEAGHSVPPVEHHPGLILAAWHQGGQAHPLHAALLKEGWALSAPPAIHIQDQAHHPNYLQNGSI